ncbi:Uma2 family endonuclease [Laspinema sp. C3]|uniref:Uma2 family endonuclease n=2 Tax=Laspinema TaxID=2584823 RepID=A0ABT2NB24_9CYAN|nr:Uma2 family endonuclease [Laspinema sp. D3b]MCT7979681.1 Uma2 family endonuclease [Laspinema sp. D3b]
MTIATQKNLTFDQFLAQYPEDGGFYELVNGELVEMRATRNHDDVADFIADGFKGEIHRMNLNYVVKNTAVIRTVSAAGIEQGRQPDVAVIDRDVWRSDRSDYNGLREPIQVAVEVTSTNWEDDYLDKFEEYQRLGIPEYWIVDYLAVGSRGFLGNPKVPTVFVFTLESPGQYRRTQFTGGDRILSPTFPELSLTAQQVLTA